MKVICDISVTSAPWRSPSWSPAELFAGGVQGAWYDPSDLTTLFQDAAGTIAVTSSDQPVGRVVDKSGFGHHAVQSVSASRPIYRTDGAFHWLEFDGVDDFMQLSSPLSLNTGTIVMALTEPAGGSGFSHLVGKSFTPGYIAIAGSGANRGLHKNYGSLYPVDTPTRFPMTARNAVGIRIQGGYIHARRWPQVTEHVNSIECSEGLGATNMLLAFSSGGELCARADFYGMCLIESEIASSDYARTLAYDNRKIVL